MHKLAILLTCYNRKEQTLNCIEKLYSQNTTVNFEVFICDDNSTDGTLQAIRKKFPQVHIEQSVGNLYWTKGMHYVMEWSRRLNFTHYLMINDDVDFNLNMIEIMLNSYISANETCGIVGSTKSRKTGLHTYGGLKYEGKKMNPIIPTENLQLCHLANWNCFLIDKEVLEQVGTIDKYYSHGLGDFDYSLMMFKKNIPIYVAPKYIGYCERNNIKNTYRDNSLSLFKRIRLLFSIKEIDLKSTYYFNKKHRGLFLFGYYNFFDTYIKNIISILLKKQIS